MKEPSNLNEQAEGSESETQQPSKERTMSNSTVTAPISAPSTAMTVAANVRAHMVGAGHNPFSLCRLAGLSRSTFRNLAGFIRKVTCNR